MVPVVVSSAIYNVNSVLDNGLLAYNFKSLGMEEEFISQWGVYTGKYHLLINVPMAVSNALSSSLIPSVSRAVATGDRRMVKKKVAAAIRFSLLIAIPSAVGLTVLAGPVNNLLFSGDNDLAVQMTLYGSIAVVFYSVSTVTNAILQGIDRMRLPIVHALTALVLHLAAMEVMVLVFHMGIFSMVFANILFAVIMCFLNHRSIRKILGYRQEVKKTILLPAAASAVMGAAAVGVYKLTPGDPEQRSLHPGGRGCCRGGLRSPSGEAWLPGRGRAAPDARRDQAFADVPEAAAHVGQTLAENP